MKRNQSGFTLIEIAIVLVIIGLLLGGVMKGQELINSAKVKNMAADFKNTSLYIYSYQDKFKALPGDDALASTHVTGASNASPTATLGDGKIDGTWNDFSSTTESTMFWQHVRLAGIAAGVTTPGVEGYIPRNTQGGVIGVTNAGQSPISDLKGAYIICSAGIQGKFAKQLDIMMDDGISNSGSIQATIEPVAAPAAAATVVDDTSSYTVCQGV